MLDTVIVGGGLCGLALANSLHGQGRAFALGVNAVPVNRTACHE